MDTSENDSEKSKSETENDIKWPEKQTGQRVFISYSTLTRSNRKLVIRLAAKLRKKNFRVLYDESGERPEHWGIWFLNAIKEADFVLMAFSNDYRECYESPHKFDRWIRYEIETLKGEMGAKNSTVNVIPVYEMHSYDDKKEASEVFLPAFFRGGMNHFGITAEVGKLTRHMRKEKRKNAHFLKRYSEDSIDWALNSVGWLNQRGIGLTLKVLGCLGLIATLGAILFSGFQTTEAMTSITDLASRVPSGHATLESVNSEFAKLDEKIQVLEVSNAKLAETIGKLSDWNVRMESIERDVSTLIDRNPRESPTLVDLDVRSKSITKKVTSIETNISNISNSVAKLEGVDFAKSADVTNTNARLKILSKELSNCKKEIREDYTSLRERVDSIRKDCLRQTIPVHGSTETTPPKPVEGKSNDNANQGSDVFFHYNMARNSFFAGHYEKAIEYLDTGLTLGNHDARLYYLRCLANNRLGQPLNARADFEKAIQQEMSGIPGKQTVNDSLQRIQGFERLWLEELREGKR